MKIALGIEYKGTNYNGWQRQHDALNIQGHLEEALSRVADHPVEVVCAGRTDSGVHALGQVIHFETTAQRDARAWLLGPNSHLPSDISVQWVKPVPVDFHARFSATARRYRYVICNRHARPAILHDQAAWQYYDLDANKMQQAAQYFLGEHDFSAIRAAGCQAKSSIREVTEARVERQGDFIYFTVKANAFLYHMVRNMVGTLLVVGRGEAPPEWVKALLETKDRRQAGATAPACGLTFMQAYYDTHFGLCD